MHKIVTLHYADVAPLRPFHTASVTLRRRGESAVSPHRHDFHEVLLVIDGAGIHRLNGADYPLTPGRIYLIRPDDHHGIQLAGRSHLHFMNVAFPSDRWLAFTALALPVTLANEWSQCGDAVSAMLQGEDFDRMAAAFRRVSQASGRSDESLELVRFWTSATTSLRAEPAEHQAATGAELPLWLERTLSAMHGIDSIQAGVPAMVAQSGVSAAHLSRTLKSAYGLTPTQFVNQTRLRRAALLLATSSLEVVEIALECGFDNLSYFYRQFRRQFSCTPRDYRIEERRRIAPF